MGGLFTIQNDNFALVSTHRHSGTFPIVCAMVGGWGLRPHYIRYDDYENIIYKFRSLAKKVAYE